MNTEAIVTAIKAAIIASIVAGLAALAAAIGADPVLHSDPVVAYIAGFVVTLLGRAGLALKDYMNQSPEPEVVPLEAHLDASAVLRQQQDASVLRRFAERDASITGGNPPSGL